MSSALRAIDGPVVALRYTYLQFQKSRLRKTQRGTGPVESADGWHGTLVAHSGDHGGWGETGSNVSDRYIETWLRAIHTALGCEYEVHTAWVESSEDLVKLGHRADQLRAAMRGRHRAGFYFLWPVAVNDGTLDEGYVKQESLLHLMLDMESGGVATRFPHPSHFYRTLLSKEWMSMLCLDPALRCPATTNLNIAAVQASPIKAAEDACKALHRLAMATAHGRAAACGRLTQEAGAGAKSEREEGSKKRRRSAGPAGPWAGLFEGEDVSSDDEGVRTSYDEEAVGDAWRHMRGVAKLGFSWEAADVLVFDGVEELAAKVRAAPLLLLLPPPHWIDDVLRLYSLKAHVDFLF